MIESNKFSFSDNSVAKNYDSVLVPVLFEPWADRLIDEFKPWTGKHVLDLATGTGIVAQRLPDQVGPNGKVFAVDINKQMLALAEKRCAGLTPAVEFIESPAHPLEVSSDSIDVVVCQQGFQFFPDKSAAAQEIFRVLRDGGQAVVTTWCPVAECQFFGIIYEALKSIGESEIGDMMRVPFDFMPSSELTSHFESAPFENVQLNRQEKELVVEGGVAAAAQLVYSTPIGPKVRELPKEKQAELQKTLTNLLNELTTDGVTMGRMVTNIVTVEK